MNILIIGKNNHLQWDLNVYMAFKRLGINTMLFQINNRSLHTNILRSSLKIFSKKQAKLITDNILSNKLRNTLKQFKPDFVFFCSAFFIPIVFYETVKEFKIPIFAWDGDGGVSYNIDLKYIDLIDILFESEYIYTKQNRLSFKQIEYLPFCANTEIFKFIEMKKYKTIFFAGASTPKRENIISHIDFPIKIRGWNWKIKKSNVEIKNKKISINNIVTEYNTHIANLNIHQEINHIHALNMRTFEIPACNALLLQDYRQELEMHFDIEKDMLVFKNYDELNEKLASIWNNQKLINKIAQNGYKKIKNFHTYEHRMQEVLKYL